MEIKIYTVIYGESGEFLKWFILIKDPELFKSILRIVVGIWRRSM